MTDLLPIANGYSNFSKRSGCAVNWQCLADDSDVSFALDDNLVCQAVIFDAFNPTALDTITRVTISNRVMFDSGIAPTFQSFIRIGGVNYTGVTHTALVSFATFTDTWAVNPATSAAWTLSDLAALEGGACILSNPSGAVFEFSQSFVTVEYTTLPMVGPCNGWRISATSTLGHSYFFVMGLPMPNIYSFTLYATLLPAGLGGMAAMGKPTIKLYWSELTFLQFNTLSRIINTVLAGDGVVYLTADRNDGSGFCNNWANVHGVTAPLDYTIRDDSRGVMYQNVILFVTDVVIDQYPARL